MEQSVENIVSQKKTFDNEIVIIQKEKQSLKSKVDDLIREQNILTKKIKQSEEFLKEYNQLVHKKQKSIAKIEENKTKIKDLNFEINEIFQSFKDIEHKLEKNKWFLENPTTDLLMLIDNELRKTSKDLFELDKELDKLQFEKTNLINRYKNLQISLLQ